MLTLALVAAYLIFAGGVGSSGLQGPTKGMEPGDGMICAVQGATSGTNCVQCIGGGLAGCVDASDSNAP